MKASTSWNWDAEVDATPEMARLESDRTLRDAEGDGDDNDNYEHKDGDKVYADGSSGGTNFAFDKSPNASGYRTTSDEALSLFPAAVYYSPHSGYQPCPAWLTSFNDAATFAAIRQSWNDSLPISINLSIYDFGLAQDLTEFVGAVGRDWALKCCHLRQGLNMTALAVQDLPGMEPSEEMFDEIGTATGMRTGDAWRAMGGVHRALVTRALKAEDAIVALATLVDHWFSEGEGAAGYLLACAEAAVRKRTIQGTIHADENVVVHPILVKNPSEEWDQARDWTEPKFAVLFVLIMAASKDQVLELSEVVAQRGLLNSAILRTLPSASLREAIDEAKASAMQSDQCAVIAVHLSDVKFNELHEENHDVEDTNITFTHWLVLGVCRQGVRVWQAGGREGLYSLLEDCERKGDSLMKWEQVQEFLKNFELFALTKVGLDSAFSFVSYRADADVE